MPPSISPHPVTTDSILAPPLVQTSHGSNDGTAADKLREAILQQVENALSRKLDALVESKDNASFTQHVLTRAITLHRKKQWCTFWAGPRL